VDALPYRVGKEGIEGIVCFRRRKVCGCFVRRPKEYKMSYDDFNFFKRATEASDRSERPNDGGGVSFYFYDRPDTSDPPP